MEIYAFISLIFWALAFSSLFIFCLISSLVYFRIKEKVFFWYALYCFLVLLYLTLKANVNYDPLLELKYSSFFGAFNWYIQILYLNVYLQFGAYFLGMNTNFPKKIKSLAFYQIAMVVFSTLIFLACVFNFIAVGYYLKYFLYFFLPIHISVVFYIIFLLWKNEENSKNYFLVGSLVYFVLAITALVKSLQMEEIEYISPIVYFYWALSGETAIFSYGLGKGISRVYKEKLKVQQDLNVANQKLQKQLQLKIKQQHEHNQLLKESNRRQKLEMKVAMLNNEVLRNQMNSHFIFNVLNSIKLFIMENDFEKANLYLSKFSLFIRKVLDGNYNEHNHLKEELEIVELYLNIEKMRFNHQFTYKIEVEPDVQPDHYVFPAMLLQPFVENAIWHGLMKKNGNKSLWINVSKTIRGCKVVIEDNGIGREKSQQSKSKMQSKKSLGLKIIEKRVSVFNYNHNADLRFYIEDLFQGTRVVITR